MVTSLLYDSNSAQSNYNKQNNNNGENDDDESKYHGANRMKHQSG